MSKVAVSDQSGLFITDSASAGQGPRERSVHVGVVVSAAVAGMARIFVIGQIGETQMAQEQTTKQGGGDDGDEAADAAGAGQDRREKLAAETDDILDEIDDVLESNAEDFVRSYVQKGGQ